MLCPLLFPLSIHSPTAPEWRNPFSEVPPPKSVTALAHIPLGASRDGTTLTFLVRAKTPSATFLGGLGYRPMHRVADSDLWILRFRMADWSRAIVTYALLDANDAPILSGVWRGPKAPLYARAARLTGTLLPRTLTSDALGEPHTIHVYLPPGRKPSDRSALPAFFLADGQDCEEFARALEPLILARRIRSCAIVGVDSGIYRRGKDEAYEQYDESRDDRARDYLPPVDPPRFARHLRFFVDEVGAYVATEFGISRRRGDRAVIGFSNGGAFSAAVARRRPEAFATAIPMSPAIQNADEMPRALAPRMMFVGGDLEPLGALARAECERLRRQGAKATYLSFRAGHDAEMWHLAFSRLAPQVFPVQR